MLKETFKIANGVEIPKIGFGTWQIPDEIAKQCVLSAIKVGYRHIDTAAAYQNEEGVGQGIRASKMARKDLFVTSKIPAELKTFEAAKASIEKSLKKLDIGYIDLMLIHAPRPWAEMRHDAGKKYFSENIEVWKALEDAYKAGKIKSIGVSNFEIEDLQNLFDHCDIRPQVNQVLMHIGHTPKELLAFCHNNGIVVEGYSPIATGRLLGNAEVEAYASKYGVTLPQLCVRYLLQLDVLPLPKTTHEEFMIENAKVDFVISPEDMERLSNLSIKTRK